MNRILFQPLLYSSVTVKDSYFYRFLFKKQDHKVSSALSYQKQQYNREHLGNIALSEQKTILSQQYPIFTIER